MPSFETGLGSNAGNWRFVLNQDGSFMAELNGNFAAEGKFTVTGNEIEIYINSVCTECSCAANIGRYNWAQQGDNLVLRKIADTCNSMVLVLTTRPLVREAD